MLDSLSYFVHRWMDNHIAEENHATCSSTCLHNRALFVPIFLSCNGLVSVLCPRFLPNNAYFKIRIFSIHDLCFCITVRTLLLLVAASALLLLSASSDSTSLRKGVSTWWVTFIIICWSKIHFLFYGAHWRVCEFSPISCIEQTQIWMCKDPGLVEHFVSGTLNFLGGAYHLCQREALEYYLRHI